MQICRAHATVVRWGVMLCKIVREIFSSFSPVNVELSLAFTILQPIETHVDGFGTSLFHSVVGNAGGTIVVDLDWCGGLGMSHFDENNADHDAFFGVEETCC